MAYGASYRASSQLAPKDSAQVDGALQDLQGQIGALYMPSPEVALKNRPHKPIRTDRKNHPEGVAVRIQAADFEQPIFSSEALDTKGFTLQNVFASITIRQDSQPTETLRMFLTLEGSYSSAFCELARSGLIPYTGPGKYTFGLVASDESLATMIRFRILARSGHREGTRVIHVFTDAMLAAGYQF